MKSTTPQIAVVIGTLNRPKVVLELIGQILKLNNKQDIELIVIDQSDHENYEKLSRDLLGNTSVSLVHFDEPNTPKYLNYGYKNAHAPIVLYLDDDVSITSSTIQAHIDPYHDKSIQAIAGRVINDGEQIAGPGKIVGKILWFGAIFQPNFSSESESLCDYPYGCNMSFRKEILEELGGFDENLAPPIYAFNELDMGIRINKKYKNSIKFEPLALVHHHQFPRGGTRNDFTAKEIFESTQWNYGYFLGKNYTFLENFLCFARRSYFQVTKEPHAVPFILRGVIAGKKNKSTTPSSHATTEVSNKTIPSP